MLFFGTSRFKTRDIYTAQYLGIAILVAVSFVGSLAGLFIDSRLIGLLGLFPIYLAVKQVVETLKEQQDEAALILGKESQGIVAIAGVTIANGGDNIGVYIPLLTTLSANGKIVFGLVFLMLVFVWCWLASQLARHPKMAHAIRAYGHLIMPVVLLLLGVFILFESGTIEMLMSHV